MPSRIPAGAPGPGQLPPGQPKAFEIIASKYDTEEFKALRPLKRFMNDLFSIFVGTTKGLHKLYEEINQINPT